MVKKTSVKEFCCRCNMAFGLAEKRVAIDSTRVMHEDCYANHLRDLATRSQRIHDFLRRMN